MRKHREQRRVAPGLAALAGVTALATAGAAAAGSYTVRRGGTLSAIAARHHTSPAALAELNHLRDPDLIRVGQRLRLAAPPQPASAAAPAAYIVQAGDTLPALAKRFGVSARALAAANGIIDGRLYRGARLRLDVSAAGAPVSPARPFTAQPSYTVRRGDTLGRVARRLGLSRTAVARANGLSTGAHLVAGEQLLVPGRWVCPVAGHTSFMNDWGFSRSGTVWHQGTDLMAARGTPVVAPVSGRLVRSPNHLGGNAFELYGDDGNRYYGAHLDAYGAQGRVRRGQVIGYVGNTGDARGGPTHLHFEIHPGGGDPVPPYPTLKAACG